MEMATRCTSDTKGGIPIYADGIQPLVTVLTLGGLTIRVNHSKLLDVLSRKIRDKIGLKPAGRRPISMPRWAALRWGEAMT